MIDLSIVVPAYNEAARIVTTVSEICAYLDARRLSGEVIVVADGDDGTRERVAELARADRRLSLYGDTARGGQGRAVRLGVARSRGRVVGFVDAGGQTPIAELDNLLPWLENGYDLVIGSRELPRRAGRRRIAAAWRLATSLWGVRDARCGFKFFRAEVACDLFARQRLDGGMFDVEVLGLAVASGYWIKEVGVRWRDAGRDLSAPAPA